jgi:glycosyltransferase involved in cell wall biosynthesis
MRIVGTNHGGYANQRNISDLPFRRYKVVRCRNVYRLPNYLHFRVRGKMHSKWPFLHWDAGLANYDLLHFFNGISLGKKPWLSTFETYLPRWGAYGGGSIEWGLSKMAEPSCKRLIALSECTRGIQAQFLEDHPAHRMDILAKVSVLHPPQEILVDERTVAAKEEVRYRNSTLQMVLVGADFFRKGGMETLRAMDILLEKGHAFHLHIVSEMKHGDYATQSTEKDLAEAMSIIWKHSAAITYHKSLPNAEVLKLFQTADIGLLPTWADTYGYSALEAMAAGCPVISTDIRALPEINTPDTGWLIPVLKDSWGNARLESDAARQAFSEHLQEALVATLENISRDPAQILNKAQAAWKRIHEMHSPEKAAEQLEAWYDNAMDD